MGCRKLEDWCHPQIEEYRASDLKLFDPQAPSRLKRRRRRKPELWKPPAADLYSVIAFHASAQPAPTTGVLDGATYTITKPTVSTGDILIVGIGLNQDTGGGTAPTITAPTGWTQIGANIGSFLSGGGAGVALFWALQSVAALGFTAHKPATGNLSLTNVCASFSGVDNVTPSDAAGTGNSNRGSATISVTTFNTVTDQALEVFVVCDWNGNSTFTQSSFNILPSTTPASLQLALCYAKAVTSPAGATGAFTVTDGASATGNVLAFQQFALRPSVTFIAPKPLSVSQAVKRSSFY